MIVAISFIASLRVTIDLSIDLCIIFNSSDLFAFGTETSSHPVALTYGELFFIVGCLSLIINCPKSDCF